MGSPADAGRRIVDHPVLGPLPEAAAVRLTVDGREVQPTLVSPQRPNGLRTDHHHRWPLDDLKPGPHTATADVRVLATGARTSRSIAFHV